jgi:hypothetical protein
LGSAQWYLPPSKVRLLKGIKEKDTELDKSSIKDEINEERLGINNKRVKDMVKYDFYIKIDLRK